MGEQRSLSLRGAILALALCAALLGGCASAPRTPFTEAEQVAAVPADVDTTRYWADAPASAFQSARFAVIQPGRPLMYLALSGGGGAYGAGVLNGWTQSGARPEFTMVSGVSTGALIAPFAFLGPAYHATLKQMYTTGEAARLIGQPNALGPIFGAGMFGPERPRRLVGRYVSDDLLKAIAREDAKGRRLLVVTTDLDAQRAVIWDMGAIASIGGPKALKLFRHVIAASASVPVLFAPQLIDVEANGRRFQEMHADGTVSVFIIVNGRLDPSFEVVPNRSVAIATQSFDTMTRVGTKAVLAQTYDAAGREGFSFHLTYVGADLPDSGGTGFETAAMRRLYNYGYQRTRSGSFWITKVSQVEAAK